MDLQTLKREFPKSYKKLQEWLNEGWKTMIEAFEKHNNGEKLEVGNLADEGIAAMISLYPRRLYDFFDTQSVYITINAMSWDAIIEVGKTDEIQEINPADNRQKIEEQAFAKAFEILEGNL